MSLEGNDTARDAVSLCVRSTPPIPLTRTRPRRPRASPSALAKNYIPCYMTQSPATLRVDRPRGPPWLGREPTYLCNHILILQ